MSGTTKWPRKKKPLASVRTCEFCSKVLSTIQALKIHRNIHTGQKPYKCNLCDFAATERKTLNCHLRRHTGETPYKCSFSGCGYKAKQNSAVKNHFAQVHSDLKPFECSLCPFKAKLNTELNQHVKKCHGETSSEVKLFSCDSCDSKFKHKSSLIKHRKSNHSVNGHDKTWSCNLCQVEFKSITTLSIHMRAKHTMEKPYICEFPSCDYSSVSKSGLTSHQLQIHNVRKEATELYKFKCSECNFQTKRKSTLENHLVVHTDQRDFSCLVENCTTSSKTKPGLKAHVKNVHEMTEKPFKCALCPFSTKTNKGLTLHHQQIHLVPEEKSALMLSCPFPDCQHKTLQRSNLKTHIKSHTNEKLNECDICPRKFLHKSSLKSHKMVHDDIKNFACSLCPYRGSSSGALKDHIRGHTKEKPFPCDFPSCGASFRKPEYLKDHLATKHGQIAKEFKCTTKGCTALPFVTLSQLHYHVKLNHGPLQMYKCSQSDCDYESKWRENVKRHERTTHNEDEISCSSCGIFRTGNKASLKNHQDYTCATRKKFKCLKCNGKFVADSLEKLDEHKIDVHGIKPRTPTNMNLFKKLSQNSE